MDTTTAESENRREREVDFSGHAYRLATGPEPDGPGWTARIVGYSLRAGAAAFQRPILEDRSQLHDRAAILTTFRAFGPTPDAALDVLTTRLLAALSEAVRINVDASLHPGF